MSCVVSGVPGVGVPGVGVPIVGVPGAAVAGTGVNVNNLLLAFLATQY